MSKSSADNRRSSDNSYWLSRRWVYQAYFTSAPIQGRSKYLDCGVDNSGRRLTVAAVGHDTPGTAANPAVSMALTKGRIGDGPVFSYCGVEFRVRPLAAKLINVLWSAAGRLVPLANVCQRLWGRPTAPTYNTFHTTVFQANATLRAARYPLQLISREGRLFFAQVDVSKTPPRRRTQSARQMK